MRRSVVSRIVFATALVAAMAACSSGPPSISDFKMGKTKDATEAASTFGAKDTLYGVAHINNPPKDGKVLGRLIIVNVDGQQAGPIPGLETTLALTGGLNTANFDFTPPTAGWPNGKYQMEVVLMDGAGAEKDKKTADFTTAGNQPAAAAAPATDSAATTDSAAAPATDSAASQQ